MTYLKKQRFRFLNQEFWSDSREVSFKQIWAKPRNWVDTPNETRGGWSAVSRDSLNTRQGILNVFIKRQQNYVCRTFRHPLRGEPTFHKELKNIQLLQQLGIPTLEPMFYAAEADKAVLVTKALDRYQSLAELAPTTLGFEQRRHLIRQLAKLARKLHRSHYVHNCFYPKHVFVRLRSDGKWVIRLIDLEKLRWRFSSKLAMFRDLSSFNRHADDCWQLKDRLYFFQSYFGCRKLTPSQRKLWRKLAAKRKPVKPI